MKNLLILISLVFSIGCTRKVHTEKTEDRSSDTQMHYIDSINKVNRTLSEAYEELLKTTNSTGVVFLKASHAIQLRGLPELPCQE